MKVTEQSYWFLGTWLGNSTAYSKVELQQVSCGSGEPGVAYLAL